MRLIISKEPEINFFFSYNFAFNNLKVKSQAGRHIALLNKCANLLNEPDLVVIAQAMRDKRNRDLYDSGTIITEKEASYYYSFVKGFFKKLNLTY